MSFIQYLNDYRLEVAAKLLTTTSDDIINISVNTGFDNLSYFNRCFKKNMEPLREGTEKTLILKSVNYIF